MAAASEFGALRPGHFDQGCLAKSELRTALRRVALKEAPDIDALYPAHYGARVSMTLADGRSVAHQVRDSLGDPERALSPRAVIEKAMSLMHYGGVPDARARQVVEAVKALLDDEAAGERTHADTVSRRVALAAVRGSAEAQARARALRSIELRRPLFHERRIAFAKIRTRKACGKAVFQLLLGLRMYTAQRIDHDLRRNDRLRRIRKQQTRIVRRCLFEPFSGDDSVDQADGGGLRCVEQATAEKHVLGVAGPHQRHQPTRVGNAVGDAELAGRDAEACVDRGEAQVARECQPAAAAHAGPLDHRKRRFGQALNGSCARRTSAL